MPRGCSYRRRPIKRNRGVALIIALLVLGVVAGVATMLANEFVLTMRRSENVLRSEQAWEYLLGAEELAALLLQQDEDPDRDHLGELWAQGMQAYPIDGGWLRGSLTDLQGRFNVNDLLRAPLEQGLPPAVPNNEVERRFIRLIRAVGGEEIDESIAVAVTEALIDWLDADIEETGFGGAEDNAYSNLDPPYRPANRPLSSVTELRQVSEMTPELYDALAPHVTVWPKRGGTININTASDQVLASLSPGPLIPLDPESVGSLIDARGEEGYESVASFAQLPAWGAELPTEKLSLKTEWYLLDTEVEIQGLFWNMQTVLARRDNRVEVIARAIGGL